MGLKSLRRISLRVWYSGFGMQDAGLVRISAFGGFVLWTRIARCNNYIHGRYIAGPQNVRPHTLNPNPKP